MNKPAILYDSYCKLCNAEIEFYKKKDSLDIFDYVDIMSPEFEPASYSLTKSDVHKYFHVLDRQGSILIGVEAFYFIWKELNTFKIFQKIYSFRLGKKILNLGYHGFVIARPYLPRKKSCGDYCEI